MANKDELDGKIDISALIDTNEDFGITYDVSPSYTVDIGQGNSTTITLDTTWTGDTVSFNSDYSFNYNQDFIDTMPSIHRVDSMCKEYPALAKVFENFKTIYKMCEQDYKGKLKERGLDDDIPF